MCKLRWLLALPLALAASVGTAGASSIRDHAGMFSPEVVRQAEAKLNQIESDTGLTTTIETIDSLNGEPIADVTRRHAQRSNTEGIYILIPKQDHKLWRLVSRPFRDALTEKRQEAIYQAFASGFAQGDFDAGLKAGVDTIVREVSAAKAENGGVLRSAVPAAGGRGPVPVRRGIPQRRTFGLSSLLGIGLLILAVLFGIRLLGALFGGARGGYAGPGPGRMGGPGYGPGYGGGGGGFFSNMLGGLGGALAGNWLYDQFSGRHHGGYTDSSAYGTGGDVGPDVSGGDTGGDWSGGGGGGDWGGGGDVGGGGDWGGGGGDWGGGGDGGGGGDW